MATSNLTKPTKEENDTIYVAARNGKVHIIKELTTRGVDVTGIVHDEINRTALHMAAREGHHNVVTFLLSHGAEVDVIDWQRNTPLHLAALHGHTDCVILLVKRGANVYMNGLYGKTALEKAMDNKHHEVVDYLSKEYQQIQKKISKLLKKAKEEQGNAKDQPLPRQGPIIDQLIDDLLLRPTTSSGSPDHGSLLAQKPTMGKLNKIVIPRVKTHWRDLANCMGYSISEVDGFDGDGRNIHECCQKLFENWLDTSHGTTPKTYETLLTCINDIKEFNTASVEKVAGLTK